MENGESSTDSAQNSEPRPTLLERWLAAAPLILSFGIWATSAPRVLQYAEYISDLRLNPSTPLAIAKMLVAGLEHVWPFTISSLLLFTLHFAWGSRQRNRLIWMSIAWLALLLFCVFVFYGGTLAAMAKLADALRKK